MKPEKNRLEWTVFWVSLVLVVATIGALVYGSFQSEEIPPDIEVRLGQVVQRGNRYTVSVVAVNRGGTTAEDVRIAVVPAGTSQAGESTEIVFPFLPRNSEKQGFVTFVQDPRRTGLETHILGYLIP